MHANLHACRFDSFTVGFIRLFLGSFSSFSKISVKITVKNRKEKEMSGEGKNEKKTVGDFNELGWYTLFVCITYEILIISQVSNLIYMIFGGLFLFFYCFSLL